jgi:hypothetical protein
MEDIGQLAGILAHDFNHIMSSTITHLSLLQKQSAAFRGISSAI